MDRYVMWMALMFIYLLLLVNGILVLATVDLKLSDRRKQKKINQWHETLLPEVQEYLQKDAIKNSVIIYDGNDLKTKVMLDLLQNTIQLDAEKMRQVCEELGYVDGVLKKAKRRLNLHWIKQLGFMRSPKAFDLLMKGTEKADFEMAYQCYYAISLLPLTEERASAYVARLIKSGIMRDRMIEMLNNLTFEAEVYWRLLKLQETELGIVTLLRVLENRLESAEGPIEKGILRYLQDDESSKEIRVASVVALASLEEEAVLKPMYERYRNEEAWEVRAAIAKAMNRFTVEDSLEQILLLKEMLYDSNWWVRFNAAEVLARKGLPGIDALVDISLNEDDPEAADLAYYILNANQSVSHTIQGAGAGVSAIG